MHHLEQIFEGAWIKIILASGTAFVFDFLQMDLAVLYIYLSLTAVDLVLGRSLAIQMGVYDPRKFKFWVRKQFTHFLLVLMVGAISYSTTQTSGWSIPAVNWFLLFLSYVESASIEDKIKALGWPVHPVVHKIFCIMRKKVTRDFSALINDPETRAELEQALRDRQDEIIASENK